MLNWLERIHREMVQVNKNLERVLAEMMPQATIVYNAATGQPLTSTEAVAEELRKCQR